MRFAFPIAVCLFIACCGDGIRRIGVYRMEESEQSEKSDPGDESKDDSKMNGVGHQSQEMEKEERDMEDPDALAAIIEQKLTADRNEKATLSALEAGMSRTGSRRGLGIEVPTAEENWKLGPEQCMSLLHASGVSSREPTFETPMVESPLLLDGFVDGVEIRPRWPRSDPVNEVVDCRLALALIAVARVAKDLGLRSILFYSAYRPIRPVPRRCDSSDAHAQCKKERKRYAKMVKRSGKSQHRRALAIDIRWLVKEDGDTVDVLEHFERRDGENPCSYETSTHEAKLLQEFVCALHLDKIFNVILTPNADKAHRNHFHLDITPDARWYIIR